MSIKYKIAFLFAILVTLFVSVVSISVYLVSSKERQDTFRTRLKNRALSTAKVYAGIKDSNYSVLRRMDTAAVASLYNKSIAIVSFTDSLIYMFSDYPDNSLSLTKEDIEQTKKIRNIFLLPGNKTQLQFTMVAAIAILL